MESTLKQELIEKIRATNDESLLELLNADYDYFKNANSESKFSELSEADNAELMTMLNEPFGKDTESFDDFKNALAKWRTK